MTGRKKTRARSGAGRPEENVAAGMKKENVDMEHTATAAAGDSVRADAGAARHGGAATAAENKDMGALKNGAGISRILLEPVISIAEVRNLYTHLQTYIDAEEDICIDASRVQMLDTAGLQLLLVFCLELEKRKRSVQWQSPSPVFRQVVELMDLSRTLHLQKA